MVSTCNGLFCLSNDKLSYSNCLCLWNPCVRKLVCLPIPNITYATHGGFDATIGFGFDPKTNDYKVVRLVTLLDSLDLERSPPEVEIYSLSTGEWRMLSASLVPKCALNCREPQAFVNGALQCIGLLLGWLMITTFNILFWCSIWATRSFAKYFCQNFQIIQVNLRVCCPILFPHMGIPLYCFKMAILVW